MFNGTFPNRWGTTLACKQIIKRAQSKCTQSNSIISPPLFCFYYSSTHHDQESVQYLATGGVEMNWGHKQQLTRAPWELPLDPYSPEMQCKKSSKERRWFGGGINASSNHCLMFFDPPGAGRPELFLKNDRRKKCHNLHRDGGKIKSDYPWQGFSKAVAT